MKKKVLFVEDNLNVFEMMKKELNPADFDIVRVRAVDEAIGALKKKGPFDCFVVDLQIYAMGLTLEKMDKYQNREGYAFLKEYVWKDKTEDEVKELKSRTIICSKYVLDFIKEYRTEIEGLQLVNKNIGFEKKVASLVKKICL